MSDEFVRWKSKSGKLSKWHRLNYCERAFCGGIPEDSVEITKNPGGDICLLHSSNEFFNKFEKKNICSRCSVLQIIYPCVCKEEEE